MTLIPNGKDMHSPTAVFLFFRTPILKAMKLTILFLLAASLTVSAKSYSQKITLKEKGISLVQLFTEIRKQTGYEFFGDQAIMNGAKKVNISVQGEPLSRVLDETLKPQGLTYSIKNNSIIIKKKDFPIQLKEENELPRNGILEETITVDVKGRVVNEKGDPLEVTIQVKGTQRGSLTNPDGYFILKNIEKDAILIFSALNVETREISINGKSDLSTITLTTVINTLVPVVINKGYYSTSQRLNTGSVSKITSDDIKRQPVSNPIIALQGRVPGLLITQRNGLPGSNLVIRIRGQNSIQQGNEPLYILDGVPFSSENLDKAGVSLSATNPFNTINPSDIESIEILKDADATAIYGSRGANGVILITTKKSRAGKMAVNLSYTVGLNKPTRTMDNLNTKQYIEMRREAFKNDGVIPNSTLAPDLYLWDTTRNTDWKEEIIKGPAFVTNFQLGITGGTKNINYSLNTGYYKEGTVLPESQNYSRGSLSFNVTNTSNNNKFSAILSALYTFDKNRLPSQDMTPFIGLLPPNMYKPYDSFGRLQWSEGGFSYGNPFSILQQKYIATSDRFIANGQLLYKLSNTITVKSNFNLNSVYFNQSSNRPIASQDPTFNPRGSASFNYSSSKIWNIEPQIDYSSSFLSRGKFQFLIGNTYQQKIDNVVYLIGSGYTNDAQINSIVGAGTINVQNDYSQYKFSSLFSRININWDDKYLFNIVARRDASSRFGPANRLANFGALGIAWVFAKENFLFNKNQPFSTGKIRFSIGSTGNDRIGDYQYLDTWTNTLNSYQTQLGLRPTRLFNEKYGWEEINKINLGFDIGISQDRFTLSIDFYRHRSKNQLVSFSLPDQTGFNSIINNIPGVIQNKGVEILLSTSNILSKVISWKTSLNLTIQRNSLIEFSGLSSSNYSNRYILGKPLNLLIGYTYQGVDPQSGIYQFDDKNKDGILNTSDYAYQGTTDPDFYGGLNNIIRYKNMELSFLFEFRKQVGRHAIFGNSNTPGGFANQPLAVLNRWQKPGDVSEYQKFTQSFGTPASDAASRTYISSAALTEASYIRLKNIALYFSLPERMTKKVGFNSCQLFLQGQNIFTSTKYVGADPENQNIQALPPMSVFTFGFNINF
jgi:TonB-dependent starch-binding outer membrane protein SusC